MKPKYLYIDDENPDALESIVNGFNCKYRLNCARAPI